MAGHLEALLLLIHFSESIMRSTGCVLLVCAGLPAFARAADADNQATRAQTVLKTHCSRCHSPDGKAKGGFDFVLDRTKMVARGKIVAGQPEESEVYQRVRDEAMPPKGIKPRVSPEDRALLKQWIEAGAPTGAESSHRFLKEEAAARMILDDLQALEPVDRRFARYFTLINLSNAAVDAESLQTTRHALWKLLNSLSWHPRTSRPLAVNAEQTIYRIDLRAYKWNARTWDRLAPIYPYRTPVDKSVAKGLTAATGAELPCVRADWFIATASRPPLYHDFLQLPERDKAIERQLGVDVADDLRENNVVRAGFNGSGVSKNNRVIERHDSNYGAYWRSYDFLENTDRQNIFEHPLGPTPGQNGFLHAGGEIIFHLPNGLQAYLLVDADGRRLDKASSEIVSDPKRPDRQVENGISCMTCHVRGILPKADQVRAHAAKNASAFSKEDAERIRALYPPDAKMRALIKDDTDRYIQALMRAGIPADESEPISTVTQRYEGTLDLVSAAAEFGLTAEEFSAGMKNSRSLARSLGPLLVKGAQCSVPRFRPFSTMP
jgi:mono/diheme cytochrome c family protein